MCLYVILGGSSQCNTSFLVFYHSMQCLWANVPGFRQVSAIFKGLPSWFSISQCSAYGPTFEVSDQSVLCLWANIPFRNISIGIETAMCYGITTHLRRESVPKAKTTDDSWQGEPAWLLVSLMLFANMFSPLYLLLAELLAIAREEEEVIAEAYEPFAL